MLPGELVTDWLRWQDLKPLLEIGDLIEFRRVAGTIKRRIYTVCFVLVVEVEAIIVCEADCILRFSRYFFTVFVIKQNGFDNAHQSLLLEYGEQNGVVICNYVIEVL